MDIVGTTVSNNITLIVKAPNQSISDHIVKCTTSWSIHNLKDHLSTVYPNKPEVSQQKIIYSGKLLQNHMVLKDCLKSYVNDQKTHTIHLVCKQALEDNKPIVMKKKPAVKVPQYQNEAATMPNPIETIMPSVESHNHGVPSQRAADGIRRRIINDGIEHPATPATYWAPGTPNVPNPSGVVPMPNEQYFYGSYNYYPGSMATPPPTPAAQTPQEYAAAHELYIRQMDEYIQNYRVSHRAYMMGAQVEHSLPTAVADQMVEQAVTPPIVEAAPAPAINDDNDDEDEDERDWLHYVYSATRVLLLMSFIYFYSTIGRFLGICFIIGFIYLYQNGLFGIFRRLPRPTPEVANASENDNNTNTAAPVPAPRSTFLIITNFCISFFTSLIPQNPEVI